MPQIMTMGPQTAAAYQELEYALCCLNSDARAALALLADTSGQKDHAAGEHIYRAMLCIQQAQSDLDTVFRVAAEVAPRETDDRDIPF